MKLRFLAYSRDGAIAFMRKAGLTVVRVANDRGWMVLGEVRP